MAERVTKSVKIDPQLWKQLKIEAAKREIEISELVDRAIRKELGNVSIRHQKE